MSKFNIIWIVIIVVGVTTIVGFIAITFYCLSKKKKNALKAYEISYVKE
jgi:flagellar basal body-associated protein FliL